MTEPASPTDVEVYQEYLGWATDFTRLGDFSSGEECFKAIVKIAERLYEISGRGTKPTLAAGVKVEHAQLAVNRDMLTDPVVWQPTKTEAFAGPEQPSGPVTPGSAGAYYTDASAAYNLPGGRR